MQSRKRITGRDKLCPYGVLTNKARLRALGAVSEANVSRVARFVQSNFLVDKKPTGTKIVPVEFYINQKSGRNGHK